MRIGVFDSGVGGLTVLKTLIKKYPYHEYIYFGDTLNVPYGNKTLEELNLLADNCVSFLISKKVDLIIIACGTVSSNCISYLKKKYSIPILDIITPVATYLNKTNLKNIAVLATSNTINSHIFKTKLSKNKTIYEIPTPDFVPLIESNNLSNISSIIASYLEPYKNKIDVVLLGCTHYPIITSYLSNYLGTSIPIIDMSNYLNIEYPPGKYSITIYFSRLEESIITNTKRILDIKAPLIKLSKEQ